MKLERIVMFAAAALTLASTPALAKTETYTLDPGHTRAVFKVRHIFTKVPGYFKTVEGTVQYDKEKIEASSVDVTIQAASIFTDNEKRDNHLRSEDFFWVEKHPTLTFKSKKVVPGEGDAFKIVGDLTIRGVTKEVTLDAKRLGVADLGANLGKRAGFEATTEIDRKDYGVAWNSKLENGGFMLGDEVEITLTVEAVAKSDMAAKQ
jgi:polyisoprenoid-binding protein YceI